MLSMAAVFALLAPDEPHFEVSPHGHIAGLVVQGSLLRLLYLIVEHADVLKADRTGWDRFTTLTMPGQHLNVLLVRLVQSFS
jgi:hypothetical protein